MGLKIGVFCSMILYTISLHVCATQSGKKLTVLNIANGKISYNKCENVIMALDKVNSHCSVFFANFIFLYTNLFITAHHFTIINSEA